MVEISPDLQFVVKERRRPRKWFFNPNKKAYWAWDYLVHRWIGKPIHGDHLPDPLWLKDKRMEMALKLPIEDRIKYPVEADAVTKALWKHWQINKDK